MKKMTCISAIACVSWLSCNNKPENPENQIKAFKHVDNNNLFEFIQIIEDFERNVGGKVSVKEATIQNNELTFKILGVKRTMNLMLNEKVLNKQKQFDDNIYAIQWLNDRGGELVFPLNINTFPLEFIVFFDYFGPNLDKIKKINGNNHNKKFSVEKGVVKLDGHDFLKLDSLDNIMALTGALGQESIHRFFDDTFSKNPITWQPNGEISFYGGENCVLFEKCGNRGYCRHLKAFLQELVSMQKVGISIDKIKIEQESNSIKLGEYPLDENIWTDYYFWDTLKQYAALFDRGEGIKIEEKNNGFSINKKPIKKDGNFFKNIKKNKDIFLSHSMFKLEPAN